MKTNAERQGAAGNAGDETLPFSLDWTLVSHLSDSPTHTLNPHPWATVVCMPVHFSAVCKPKFNSQSNATLSKHK